MRTTTIVEAQRHLPQLVAEAKGEVIGLTDAAGNLVGLLSGIGEQDLDDLLVETIGFQTMIERSRHSLEGSPAVSVEDLLAEAQAERAGEPTD